MFRNLLGIELSQLRFALMCSYIGSFVLMATGLMFALPSIFIEFTNDAPDFSTFAWILVVVGIVRFISTYMYAMGKKFLFYIVIALSILKIIEIPAAVIGESTGFIIWYVLLTGIIELLLLLNIFSKNAREEHSKI
ncbi:MAG: hypothetical protein CL893_03380 [Dehalococcoidia bacterium]|nr:hypothetical protein [Dehalococcoidia bacterium]|tara:strand:+ start:49 stop:456 length:408 start_codon:yes stop_codon:yes gene_type:complete